MVRSSFIFFEGHVRRHVLHPVYGVGNLKLAQLTTSRVGKFRDELRAAGVSVPSTRKIIGTVKSILEHARSQDLVGANAAAGVRVIGRRDEGPKKITPPSKAEMKALLEAATPTFRRRIQFAAATGVRASELHALRWRHVDLVKGEVRIETRVDRWKQEDTTKTEAGIRTIPLGSATASMLKEWRIQSRYSRDDDLLFPNKWGRFEDHSNMSAVQFVPTRERAGLPDLNWHALRHFAISCWIERGLSPKTVQTFAGHKSLTVTMDRYGHLFRSEDHRVVMDAIAGELFS
jgi:integrase